MLSALGLAFAAVTFSGYLQRTSAQRAAQVFARDLTLARTNALRAREPVVIRFYEASRWYSVNLQESGTELVRRRFGVNADIPLSEIAISQRGDTLVFSSRGVAALDSGGRVRGLGDATFTAGTSEYVVSFNGLGASKVEEN